MTQKRDRIFILNDPHALRISGELAQEIGLNESIVLLQVEFLISISDNERDGQRWTYQSIRDLQRNYFPWWSIATINRTIESLAEKRLLTVGNYNKAKYDRTRWLALNMDGIAELQSVRVFHALFQNETRSAQNETRSAQDETTIPETTTETTTDKRDKDRAQAQKPRRAAPKASSASSPSEPDAPKPQKISDLPAAQVYREIVHAWPKAAAYADLAPINNGGMQRWRDVVHEWVLRGYNPANLRGMLEWYKAGIPTRAGGNQGQQRQSGVAAVEAFKQMVGICGDDDDSVIDVEVK